MLIIIITRLNTHTHTHTTTYPLKKEKSQMRKFWSNCFSSSISASLSSKSKSSKFSRSLPGLVLLGMTITPLWIACLSRIWPAVRPCA